MKQTSKLIVSTLTSEAGQEAGREIAYATTVVAAANRLVRARTPVDYSDAFTALREALDADA